MTRVRVEGIVKRFGDTPAIEGVSLDVRPGELFTLVGPSGCGKTTLLRIIAGLLDQDAGRVLFNEDRVDDVPSYLRNIGVVFQNYAIFPHLTVGENIAYGLKARRVPPDRIATKVAEAARLVQLEGLLDRMPAQLSGGQQQRVVLARALVIEPRLLLMDEPLSNLDAKLRVQIRSLIRALQRTLRITTIYVTHDQEEALAISDTIAVMDRGRILQVGKPWELYLQPATRFVADFIGTMNVLHGKVEGPGPGPGALTVVTDFGERWQVQAAGSPGQPISLGIRPESLQLVPGTNAVEAWNSLKGTVTEVVYLGAVVRYQVKVREDLLVTAEIHNPDFGAICGVGDRLTLWFAAARAIPMPGETGPA
ncbi:MAG: ABC transporter ATP-binding protein [candidate division NC10 bacterium]|nr:ABC transporter ATP-binding protein [candidate division NC10 bacterium]